MRKHSMTETELNNLLGKIGKSVFVQYFREFSDPNLSNQDVIALLPQEYTFKSRTSRTSKSRRILREGMAEEALSIIETSDHVEPEVSMQARVLLAQIRIRR
jgi:hypothetical protein